MCLGSRCVLCDFSNTLGLAKAKTHSVKFLFPFVFKPMCIQEKCGPSDSHSFSLNSTKNCLGRARKCPSSKSSLFNGSLIRISFSHPPNSLTTSKQAKHFHFLCERKLGVPLPFTFFSAYWLLLFQVQSEVFLLCEGFLHGLTCKYSHPPLCTVCFSYLWSTSVQKY